MAAWGGAAAANADIVVCVCALEEGRAPERYPSVTTPRKKNAKAKEHRQAASFSRAPDRVADARALARACVQGFGARP